MSVTIDVRLTTRSNKEDLLKEFAYWENVTEVLLPKCTAANSGHGNSGREMDYYVMVANNAENNLKRLGEDLSGLQGFIAGVKRALAGVDRDAKLSSDDLGGYVDYFNDIAGKIRNSGILNILTTEEEEKISAFRIEKALSIAVYGKGAANEGDKGQQPEEGTLVPSSPPSFVGALTKAGKVGATAAVGYLMGGAIASLCFKIALASALLNPIAFVGVCAAFALTAAAKHVQTQSSSSMIR